MQLPFTIEQFLGVFEKFNLAIWPLHLIVYLLAIISVALVFKPFQHSNRIITVILAFFWLFMGVGYHWMFFSVINKAAYIFGFLFILQGVLFLVFGPKLRFEFQPNLSSVFGLVLIVYAMLGYSLLGYYLGHTYPHAPVFGVAPCPTTIFTFGLLLLTSGKMPEFLIAIPFIWSIIGFFAALNLGILEDIGLIIAGLYWRFKIITGSCKKEKEASV